MKKMFNFFAIFVLCSAAYNYSIEAFSPMDRRTRATDEKKQLVLVSELLEQISTLLKDKKSTSLDKINVLHKAKNELDYSDGDDDSDYDDDDDDDDENEHDLFNKLRTRSNGPSSRKLSLVNLLNNKNKDKKRISFLPTENRQPTKQNYKKMIESAEEKLASSCRRGLQQNPIHINAELALQLVNFNGRENAPSDKLKHLYNCWKELSSLIENNDYHSPQASFYSSSTTIESDTHKKELSASEKRLIEQGNQTYDPYEDTGLIERFISRFRYP
jgi:hypothetical protein